MTERRSVIRHIATSWDGDVVAVAEFERHVQIWNVQSHQRISAFESTLDFGGNRLAITRKGDHCAIGAYHVHGIALYDSATGNETWRRKDLKKVQTIRISNDEQRVLCAFEGKSFEPLNINNGRSKPSLRGVQDVVESHYDPVIVFDRKKRDYKLTTDENKQIATLPRKRFAAIEFAFAPGKLCITESGGTIRCFDIANGQQLWEHDPGRGVHAIELAYNEPADTFAGVTWPYQEGGEHQLVNLDSDTGTVQAIASITSAYEFAFCYKGSILLSSDGNLRNTTTAEINAVLDFFPNTENAG